MKYILEYNNYSEIYIKTTYSDYMNSHSKIIDFNGKFIYSIDRIFKQYQNNNIIEDGTDSGLFIEYYGDGYTTLILKYKRLLLDDSRIYKKHFFIMNIYQTEDEWFFVSLYEHPIGWGFGNIRGNRRVNPAQLKKTYYKCDQIDGLLNLVCDAIENPFDKINI